jgi:hypothetical protein
MSHMSGDPLEALKAKVKAMNEDPKSGYGILQKLIVDGELDEPVSSATIVQRIREKIGRRWQTAYVQTYMKKFMRLGIVQAVKPKGSNTSYWILAHIRRDDALRRIHKESKVRDVEHELFSTKLVAKLRKDFSEEIEELRDNFGKNGLSTAFLLRKILEKLIIIVLGKNGRQHLLKDKRQTDRWLGLNEMIDVAVHESVSGVPFLVSKTAREIKGIKFLGDAAAHNPLATVDTKTIIPQMPYIITAYDELAKRL